MKRTNALMARDIPSAAGVGAAVSAPSTSQDGTSAAAGTGDPDDRPGPDSTVAEAWARAKRKADAVAGDALLIHSNADDTVAHFKHYKQPEKLYDAVVAVAHAAAAWASDTGAGTALADLFAEHGFPRQYEATNCVARDRRYRKKYRISVDGRTLRMEPHLKVDDNTTYDQCLRLYWAYDKEGGRVVLGHVGHHLPPVK